jgi:hypothetical protein
VVQLAEEGQSREADAHQAAVLQLLCDHDLEGASAVAAASGYPHLATLLTTAGFNTSSMRLIAQQLGLPSAAAPSLNSWSSAHLLNGLIPEQLAAIYFLLGGDPKAALQNQTCQRYTWHCALGLCMWYCTAPNSSANKAMKLYNSLTGSCAPPPRPLHARHYSASDPPVDAQYALLELHTAGKDAAQGRRVAAIAERLSRTDSFSNDALNALLPWMVLSILRAISTSPLAQSVSVAESLEGEASCSEAAEVDAVYAKATVSCADSLRLLGEPLWALYVLLHLPRSHDKDDAKALAIRRVLKQEWMAVQRMTDVDADRFLCTEWHVPREWLQGL